MPFVDNIGFLMSRASGQLVRATNAALAEHGLRVRQYSVLCLACESVEGLSQRDLAGVLALDPSQVVTLVDELARVGWVERRPSPADRRTKLVVPTDLGREVRERAAVRAEAGLAAALGPLSPDERAALRSLLARVVALDVSATT